MKIEFKVHTRQPNIQFIEDLSIRQPGHAKQFGLRNLKEANVRAVKNDARGVHVAPSHAFFDGEYFAHLVVNRSILIQEFCPSSTSTRGRVFRRRNLRTKAAALYKFCGRER